MTGLSWFKIYEDGLTVSDQTWGVDRLIANKGQHPILSVDRAARRTYALRLIFEGKVTFNLPSCIEAGQYLLRVEIIGELPHVLSSCCARMTQVSVCLHSLACGELLPRCSALRA